MGGTDKLIAATFAAATIGKIGIAKLADFFGHYDACMRELQDRETATGNAATDRALATFDKLGR
jgi:hypothetical protein